MLDSGKIAYRFRYALLALALLVMAGVGYYFIIEFHADTLACAIIISVMLFLAFIFLGPRKNWPVRLAQRARPLKSSIATGGFIAAALTVGAIFTILETVDYWQEFQVFFNLPIFILVVLTLWCLWTILFWALVAKSDRFAGLSRITRRLVAGSILELFASILVQMFLPDRNHCTCDRGSFWGILIGSFVTFWVFGPAIVLVFMYERVRMARIDALKNCPHCEYDLTGTRAAGLTQCPECGRPVL